MRELGTIERQADGTYTLRLIRYLRAARADVWAVLTERGRCDGWLGDLRFTPDVGSEVTLDFGDGEGICGELLAYDPERRFAITWIEPDDVHAKSTVCFDLMDDGDGTLLALTHARQPAAMARSTAAGWHAHLELLIGAAAGAMPAWEDVYPPAREAYAERLATVQ